MANPRDAFRAIELFDDVKTKINQLLEQAPLDLLFIPRVREILTISRWKRLRAFGLDKLSSEDDGVRENTVEKNLVNLEKMVGLNRPMQIVAPLYAIDDLRKRLATAQVLCIGPRSEAEILTLLTVGFHLGNIRGLDLMSYSPWVDIGDAHSMQYDDNTFDVVVLGWVLAYSSDNQKMVDDICRVAKPGAYVSVGCQYTPMSPEFYSEKYGMSVETTKFETPDDVLKLFGDRVASVVFQDGPLESDRDRTGDVIVVVRLK